MITTIQAEQLRDAMNLAANKLSNLLPEHKMLRLGAAMLDRKVKCHDMLRELDNMSSRVENQGLFTIMCDELTDHADIAAAASNQIQSLLDDHYSRKERVAA